MKEQAKKEVDAIARDMKDAVKEAKSALASIPKAAAPKKLTAGEVPVPPPGAPAAVQPNPPAPAVSVEASPVVAALPVEPPPPAIIRDADDLPAHLTGSATLLPLAMPLPTSVGAEAVASAAKKAQAAQTPRLAIASGLADPAPASTPAPAAEKAPAPPVEVAVAPEPMAAAPPPVEKPSPDTPAVQAGRTAEAPPAVDGHSVAAAEVKKTPLAPHPVNVMELTGSKTRVVNDLPLDSLPAESEDPVPAPHEPVRILNDDLPPAVLADKTQKSKPVVAVTPSMNNVRRTAYEESVFQRPVELQPSSDFFPSPPTQPEPVLETPEVDVNPKLGAMTIDAERADSDNEKNTVSFAGNVSVDCKRFALRADRVISYLRPKTKGGGMSKVEAFGKVIVHMNGENGRGYTATGSKAIYDPENETIRLTGWPKIEEAGKALVANSASTEILIDTRSSRLTTTGATKTLLNR